jgi:hypothetical protein
MLAIRTPRLDDQTQRRSVNVIMYIWTAPGTGTANFRRATGVSDDQQRAREAAEAALRTGQADTAYVERVYTAVATPSLSLCYVRTGTGWRARFGQAGRVEWTPLDPGEAAPGEAAPGECRQWKWPPPHRPSWQQPASDTATPR